MQARGLEGAGAAGCSPVLMSETAVELKRDFFLPYPSKKRPGSKVTRIISKIYLILMRIFFYSLLVCLVVFNALPGAKGKLFGGRKLLSEGTVKFLSLFTVNASLGHKRWTANRTQVSRTLISHRLATFLLICLCNFETETR